MVRCLFYFLYFVGYFVVHFVLYVCPKYPALFLRDTLLATSPLIQPLFPQVNPFPWVEMNF